MDGLGSMGRLVRGEADVALSVIGNAYSWVSAIFYLVLRASAHLLLGIGVVGLLGLLQAHGACGPIEAMKDLQNIMNDACRHTFAQASEIVIRKESEI